MSVPKLQEWVADRQQRLLLEESERSFRFAAEVKAEAKAKTKTNGYYAERREAAYRHLSELFDQEISNGTVDATVDGAAARGSSASDPPASPAGDSALASASAEAIGGSAPAPAPAASAPVSAILTIDKIGLKLPVLEGATEENMKKAAVHMEETAPLGAAGNAAIAAHRARTKGRLFNRLNELEAGDTISLTMKDSSVTYSVYQVSRVLPTDVSVLLPIGSEKILTLITCDPIENATHRIIVQAKSEQHPPPS